MKYTGACPKCGSTDVAADARAVDRGHANAMLELTIATFRKPRAWFFKARQETPVSAWVCMSCGFVEFYADNPEAIRLPESK